MVQNFRYLINLLIINLIIYTMQKLLEKYVYYM